MKTVLCPSPECIDGGIFDGFMGELEIICPICEGKTVISEEYNIKLGKIIAPFITKEKDRSEKIVDKFRKECSNEIKELERRLNHIRNYVQTLSVAHEEIQVMLQIIDGKLDE